MPPLRLALLIAAVLVAAGVTVAGLAWLGPVALALAGVAAVLGSILVRVRR